MLPGNGLFGAERGFGDSRREAGGAVIPDKYSLSQPAASAERKKAPTLYRLRTLCSRMETGIGRRPS